MLVPDNWSAVAETRLLTDVEALTPEAEAAWVRMLVTVLLLPKFKGVVLVLMVLTKLLTTAPEKSTDSLLLAPWIRLLPTSIRFDTITPAALI